MIGVHFIMGHRTANKKRKKQEQGESLASLSKVDFLACITKFISHIFCKEAISGHICMFIRLIIVIIS